MPSFRNNIVLESLLKNLIFCALVKFMFSQEFRKQLFPQRHDKSLILSIKNLKVSMIPDPTTANPEDKKSVRAIDELRIADQELKERQDECDRLFGRNSQ